MNIPELLRLLHNLIRLGTIAEVDHRAARVRVKTGELLTDWLPWLEGRAGTTRDWDPPTKGEQVILFSPGGDPANGVVLCGLCSNAHPAPAEVATLWRRIFLRPFATFFRPQNLSKMQHFMWFLRFRDRVGHFEVPRTIDV